MNRNLGGLKWLKVLGIFTLAGFLLYSAGMIIIRLKMTEYAYDFDDLKREERELHEEQQRLRVRLSEALTPRELKTEGFAAPEPRQVVVIP